MTVQHSGTSLSRRGSRLLRPLPAPQNRTAAVIERLAGEIATGRYAPGERLPTEQEMMAAMGVSRTVVREAVAALRAEGLVVTRQGLGAFVASDPATRPFRIDPAGLRSIAEVIDVMELRIAVETEAAALAAMRAAALGRQAIAAALAAIERAIARGEEAIDEDAAFHHAIGEATGNPQFVRFLEYLGRFIIPRRSIRVAANPPTDRRSYLDVIQAEHKAIAAAIAAGDAAAARGAMYAHLANGRERYRRLAGGAK